MTKSFRHSQILRIVERQRIFTQDELARELASAGLQTTQVTLSRDMRELGLVKTAAGYQPMASAQPVAGPDLATVIGEFLTDARVAMNQLVLRTTPGSASSVATALDRESWTEIIGTIAGDDTVLVIAADADQAVQLRDRILALA